MKTFPQLLRVAFGAGLFVSAAQFGTVTGRVVDTQSTLPIAGATITIGNIVSVTAPNDKGGFVLRNVPVGTRPLRIDASGWQRYTTSVTVKKDQATDIGVIGLPSTLTSH